MIIGFSISVMTYENLLRSVRFKNCFLKCNGNLVNIVLYCKPEIYLPFIRVLIFVENEQRGCRKNCILVVRMEQNNQDNKE